MQNPGLATRLGKSIFSVQAALPGALFSIRHNLTGAPLAGYGRRRLWDGFPMYPINQEQNNQS